MIKGKEGDYFDAVKIENQFKNETITYKDVKSEWIKRIKQKVEKKLEEGDYHVLALAERGGAREILTDDMTLGSMALLLGFQSLTASDILLESLVKKLIDLNDYKTSIRLLIVEKRIMPDITEAYVLRGEKNVGRKNEKS